MGRPCIKILLLKVNWTEMPVTIFHQLSETWSDYRNIEGSVTQRRNSILAILRDISLEVHLGLKKLSLCFASH